MIGQRKLAAILAADVVGFSRLAGADEDRTLARLRALHSDLIDPTIAVHGGRVVKRTGDGVLVDFRSVVDAVRCAIEIQESMVERNAGVPADRQIVFRVGVHLGDVVEERDGDLMGDGVNIAARLEAAAAPGAICLSEDAYRQVKGRVGLPVRDLGYVKLKNIADPVRIYSLDAAAVTTSPTPAIGLKATDSLPTLPDKPSIAVLPFANMSGDPEQDYFADGMVEEITTALSRFNQLFVIARNSSFVYKGRAIDVRQAAAELGVRYVLEGSVRRSGPRLRITGQLIDAVTGGHLWADRFDGSLEDVFDVQDKITERVVGAIEPTIRKAEIERVRRKRIENLNAYDHYIRALSHVDAFKPDENLEALMLLLKAIDLDPSFALAVAFAAWCLEQRATRGWPPAGKDDAGRAIALARQALNIGGDDATVLAISGIVLVRVAGDYNAGLDAAKRALRLNPGSGFVALQSSVVLMLAGDPEEALVHAERAMALNPLDPSFYLYLTNAGFGHLLSGRPLQAIEMGRRSASLYADWDTTYWLLVPAFVQVGRLEDARAAVAKMTELSPGITVSKLQKVLAFKDPAAVAMILEGFRTAGLPE
ncbi:adenylate/guanylate cyclase domain-containing protein [Rhizobium sp. 3T7]|uniref:adenylate/guanylate cyclase domain-containing protein n=1 Tax=Rhizobium sp. 3T7 TaxID=2874922 RepID=UPI001CCFA931|nr:adenylate/guanylate cyclase domain-containing protein [Rhizobium sp. 3T7]MBZ9791683.1 adenylate/guanylate cyclase domain-containing protein [Rhizobium sp. 3T7]